MPYIEPPMRDELDKGIAVIFKNGLMTSGDLNYVITKLMLGYVGDSKLKPYTGSVMALGTLVCAGLEFYRRFTAPYEDQKIKDNGDVYPD